MRCLPLACLLLAACTHEPPARESPQAKRSSFPTKPAAMQAALAVPKQFLHWYASQMTHLNTLYYEIPAGSFKAANGLDYYDVNFKAATSYLAALAKSGLLSPAYGAAQRLYYRQQQDSLHAHPANDGPPQGFEYDRIIYSQDPEDLTDLLKMQPRILRYSADSARVCLGDASNITTSDASATSALVFQLSRHGSQWLIDDITRVTKPQ